MLVAAGHEVTGTTRTREKAAAIEVVVQQLTALPDRWDPRKPDIYEATNRLRLGSTRTLLEAAPGVRVVAQSVAFAYRPHAEPRVLDAGGLVLRYGWFYGPGTYFGEGGSMASDVARRRFPVVGKGTGLFSFVHVEDAAAATVGAVEHGAPGVYNLVDDEPAPIREWIPAYAEAIGARRPLRVPVWLARLVTGKDAAAMMTTLPGASNARAKRELGWEPRWPSWRTGFSQAPR
jgi:2-alkyl-3-oxoalkanoate reductase